MEEIKTMEADVVGFADDIFTADMDWVERVCDLLIQEGIKKKYVINARLEIAKRPDVLKKMYKAGFMIFLLGIESAHDKTLKSMKKGFSTAKIAEYFKILRQFYFIYHCYFIIGNIGETKQEMFDIVKFSHRLGVDTLGLSVLRATKFSPLKDMLKEFDDYHIEAASGKVYSNWFSVEELQQIRRDVYSEFFSILVIMRLIKKMVLHRIFSIQRVCKSIIFIATKKMNKRTKRKRAYKASKWQTD